MALKTIEILYVKLGGMAKNLIKRHYEKQGDNAVRKKRFCISKRQGALLLSNLYLICFVLITGVGVIVTRRNNEVLSMVGGDFDYERSKHTDTDPLTANERKLQYSKENLDKVISVLYTYLANMYLQCISAILLCVGILFNKPKLILQWLISSGLLYGAVGVIVIAFNFDLLPQFYWCHSMSIVFYSLTPIWLKIWLYMMWYYPDQVMKKKLERKEKGNIVKTHGGLTHVVIY